MIFSQKSESNGGDEDESDDEREASEINSRAFLYEEGTEAPDPNGGKGAFNKFKIFRKKQVFLISSLYVHMRVHAGVSVFIIHMCCFCSGRTLSQVLPDGARSFVEKFPELFRAFLEAQRTHSSSV